jgi:hypothetical protein
MEDNINILVNGRQLKFLQMEEDLRKGSHALIRELVQNSAQLSLSSAWLSLNIDIENSAQLG